MMHDCGVWIAVPQFCLTNLLLCLDTEDMGITEEAARQTCQLVHCLCMTDESLPLATSNRFQSEGKVPWDA